MSHQLFMRMSVLAAAATAVVLTSTPASAQALAAAKTTGAKTWTAKTPDGQPDLQAVWSNNTDVPLERPQNLGAKEFYTAEEVAERQKRQAAAAARAQEGPQTQPGTQADVHYDLTQFALTRNQATTPKSERTSLITGPEGRLPPLLPEAQKRVNERTAANRGHQFDGPENRALSERCIMWPNEGPPMMPVGYNSNMQIVQGPGYVAIMQEMIHDVRIIPLDNRPHLPSSIRQYFGDSRGHWEGDTLVVDTTNFTDKTNFRNSSDKLHVVERFHRPDADTLVYQFTVDDPTTWDKPWSAEVTMAKTDGLVYEYACQEGNYGMANILSGARATEKAEAAKKATN